MLKPLLPSRGLCACRRVRRCSFPWLIVLRSGVPAVFQADPIGGAQLMVWRAQAV